MYYLHFRYKVGQRFGRHIDESVVLGEGKRTYYTLLVYLSGAKSATNNPNDSHVDPLVGGETVFYGSRNSVVAEVADRFLFLSIRIWLFNISIPLHMSWELYLL